MRRTRLVETNDGQVVRLADAVAFPPGVRAVEVRVEGNTRVLAPVGADWDPLFDAPGVDFPDRNQPMAAEEREAF
ncbi:MAG: AbrB/MazE/SpoVT family DNA-binding domain-containing protein [Alphaproteobacteria bacterium]|nr:AbrB/MazE/SpoVT family DNA-binding domain-containing protein [Alphaproteobacteria bacterium]